MIKFLKYRVVSAILLLVVISVKSQDISSVPVYYSADDFQNEIFKIPHLVMFYAPWCGHCQRLTTTYDKLAEKYNVDVKKKVTIAKVDCTQYTALCSDQDIIGYPTLRFFWKDPNLNVKYKGKRDFISLQLFVEEMLKLDSPPLPVSDQGPTADFQKTKISPFELTDEIFQSTILSGHHFVKFYAPWCSHCQAMAPAWEQLRETFEDGDRVTISKIDCTKYATICRQHSIKGYPSLVFFSDGQKVSEYFGVREHDPLKEFVLSMVEKSDDSDSDDSKPEVIPDSKSTDNEKEEEKSGEVFTITDSTLFSRSGFIFVDFFQPWCQHCKNLVPVWDELAKIWNLKDEVLIGMVDCSQETKLCRLFEITKFPTLVLFKDGKKKKVPTATLR